MPNNSLERTNPRALRFARPLRFAAQLKRWAASGTVLVHFMMSEDTPAAKKRPYIPMLAWMISIILLWFLVGRPVAAVIRHNSALSHLRKEFRFLPTPPKSRLLAEHSEVGLLVGNGDHCDFYVGRIWCSELPYEAFLKTIDKCEVHGVYLPMRGGGMPGRIVPTADGFTFREVTATEYRLSVGVAPLIPQSQETLRTPYFGSFRDWGVDESICGPNPAYLTYVLDDAHDPAGDWRCY